MLSNWTVWNDPLWNELDRTLAAFGRRPLGNGRAVRSGRVATPGTRPAGALWARRTEDGAAYLVGADLPGVRAEGLTLEIEGRRLSLTALRADERGRYEHALTLPDDADTTATAAEAEETPEV